MQVQCTSENAQDSKEKYVHLYKGAGEYTKYINCIEGNAFNASTAGITVNRYIESVDQ